MLVCTNAAALLSGILVFRYPAIPVASDSDRVKNCEKYASPLHGVRPKKLFLNSVCRIPVTDIVEVPGTMTGRAGYFRGYDRSSGTPAMPARFGRIGNGIFSGAAADRARGPGQDIVSGPGTECAGSFDQVRMKKKFLRILVHHLHWIILRFKYRFGISPENFAGFLKERQRKLTQNRLLRTRMPHSPVRHRHISSGCNSRGANRG